LSPASQAAHPAWLLSTQVWVNGAIPLASQKMHAGQWGEHSPGLPSCRGGIAARGALVCLGLANFMTFSLVTKRFDGIEARRLASGIISEKDTDGTGKQRGDDDG
jgi:hypothetical protein